MATSSYHATGNGGMERVNDMMAQLMAVVFNEHQNNWDLQLSHVEFAYNNSVTAVTGLAPEEVHMSGLPRLPLTSSERTGVGGHQNLPAITSPTAPWRPTANSALTISSMKTTPSVSRVERRNSALSEALRPVPTFAVGRWVWVYNTAATTRQGAKTDTETPRSSKSNFRSTG